MKTIALLLLMALPPSDVLPADSPYLIILGVAQDGGYPHIGCMKECCAAAWKKDSLRRHVVSFALVDPAAKKWWLFEATPDFTDQLHLFRSITKEQFEFLPAGIFVTHAHIGHYTGLMYLGREALGASGVPVYTLPRLSDYLRNNGPWSQLVGIGNIRPEGLTAGKEVSLSEAVAVEAFTVPHRDEFSETAGFRITAGNRKYLFIPDIDKWPKADFDIVQEVKRTDIALLDATFYSTDELPGKTMAAVPHPFVPETMELFKNEPVETRRKIFFIHFNHTNPLLCSEEERKKVRASGFELAEQGMRLR